MGLFFKAIHILDLVPKTYLLVGVQAPKYKPVTCWKDLSQGLLNGKLYS